MSRSSRLRKRRRRASGRRTARLRWLIVALSLLSEAIPLWRRGYGVGGNVVARCRDGHLFTTLWIPGISVKSVRFGPWRLQHCPVGRHWSIVTPVRRADLGEEERRGAGAVHDVRIP